MTTTARLLDPGVWALLASLPPYDPAEAPKLGERLRARGLDGDLVATLLTQLHLRARAHAKFGDFADSMLFTDTGLQQATRLVVAAHHAGRYRAAGCAQVADLGCGIGADSLALAGLGIAVDAVEWDEETAALALVNLMAFPGARVLHADALDLDLSPYDGLFADPARRGPSGRVFDPGGYSPPLPTLLALRGRIPELGVKVGPGIRYEDIPGDAHAQWVSVDGHVVEAGLWFGALADGPGRSALVIDGDRPAVLATATSPDAPAARATTGPLQRFLHEPDGAVIRAGGVAPLAAALGATVVSDSIAYLTSASPAATPFAETFEILDHFPYSRKRLAGYLAARGVGSLEIKKRGVDIVPDVLRKQLGLRGDGEATVVLTRLEGRHSALIVRRIGASHGTMDA
ncbi:MAG: THUMP-like domain-containing protein [Actinomycetota bacterium]